MGKALADAFPICRERSRRPTPRSASRSSRAVLRRPGGSADADREHAAGDSGRQHRRVSAARVAGLTPAFVAGHSLGEYSAQRRRRHVRVCRRAAHRAAPRPVHAGGGAGRRRRDGGDSRPRRRQACAQACEEAAQGDVVSPANLNGAGQVVIAGARDAVARAGERAKALGARRVVPLPVSAPFHCALMKPAEERLAPELRALRGARSARAGRGQRRRRAETRRGGGDRGARARRCRRRCAGRPSSGALRPRASQRMLRWVRARC